MSDHDDFAFEPVAGLPAPLPAGEKLLWQGAPKWSSFAVHAYHVRKVALYFLALEVWRVAAGVSLGHQTGAILLGCLWLACLGGIAMGVLSLLAYCSARMTVYSITSERVILRHGVAVPLTMNVPFALIEAAAVRRYADGCGDLCLALPRQNRVGYLITWPHLRPSRFSQPEPSFRALADVDDAAQILAAALRAHAAVQQPALGGAAAPAGTAAQPGSAQPLAGARPSGVRGQTVAAA